MKAQLAAILLLTLGCSAEQGASRAQAPPAPLTVASQPSATAQSTASLPELDTVKLEDFSPLLALPELKRSADAVENDDYAAAAREVERLMATANLAGVNVARFQYLLARLREQGGDVKGAAASYELAATAAWPLRSYALLGAGRAWVRAGYPQQGATLLKQVPADEPIVTEAQAAIAEAASLMGDKGLAIEMWRARLTAKPQPTDWASTSLRLGTALLEQATTSVAGASQSADVVKAAEEVLALARAVYIRAASDVDAVTAARDLESRALLLLPAPERARLSAPTLSDQLTRISVLVDARHWSDALVSANALIASIPPRDRWSSLACEAHIYRAKALAGDKQWGSAADHLGDVVHNCQDPDAIARALFLQGKYSDADKRYSRAVQSYAELERRFPTDRLADDARVRGALSYLELGAEARYTELLSTIADDYPAGDVVLDGVFHLASRRMQRGDWRGALTILERATTLPSENDRSRGQEYAGRERYFLARAHLETGDKAKALDEYERIVAEMPLSYYMLHAYARLLELDPARAKLARDRAISAAAQAPFIFERRPEFDQPGFTRALELLRQGDVDLAKHELDLLGLPSPDAAPSLLWNVALVYARAGAAKLSHAVARGLLTDWLERWPAGGWAKAWELAFPRPYKDFVDREAKKNDVPEHLVYAIMREESAFEPEAVSPADAYGLMQLIEPTARHYGSPIGLPSDPASLKKPRINIAIGCRVLGKLLKTFSDNPLLAVPAYNAGPAAPRRWVKERPGDDFDLWVELIPYGETRRYTKRVLASRAAYAFLYEPQYADAALRLPAKVTN